MDKHLITVKEVPLNNNCPECYGQGGLIMTFRQKVVETKFYKSVTSYTQYEINCNTCKSVIYPERWTEDIERVVEYQEKAFRPMMSSTYIKNPTWVVIAAVGVLITAILLMLYLA